MNKNYKDQLEEALAKIASLEAKLFASESYYSAIVKTLTAERDCAREERDKLTNDNNEMIKKLADLRSEAATKQGKLVEMNDKLIRHNGKLQSCFDAAMELVEQLRRD